jgi:hypothetical protein
MTIKAVEATANDGETSTTLEIDAPDDVKQEIGEYLVEQILAYTAESKSPVAGYGKFPSLSKKYKEKKEESGRSGVPNLDFDGDMLGALDFEVTEDGIKIGVFGDQAPKADGHNNLSGQSELPLRRFLPDAGEAFNKNIDAEIEAILAERAVKESVEDVPEFVDEALEVIDSREELFSFLTDLTGIQEEYLLRSAVLTNKTLFNKIKAAGLAGYLKK